MSDSWKLILIGTVGGVIGTRLYMWLIQPIVLGWFK